MHSLILPDILTFDSTKIRGNAISPCDFTRAVKCEYQLYFRTQLSPIFKERQITKIEIASGVRSF